MKIRFSVLMPVYNRDRLVRQTIDSLLAQTFTDFEVFAIDDGSTDGTLEVLASYGSRIQVIHQCNQGPEVARNRAAAAAQGEYLVLLDSDDLLRPCALATYDRVAEACGSPPLIIGSMTYFQDGQALPVERQTTASIAVHKYRDYLSKDVGIGLSNSRIVVRKSVFDEIGGLRNSTPATFHLDDFNLILKVGTYGPCVVIDQPHTVLYRSHESNSIRNPQAMVDGVLSLVRSEHERRYPGGENRRIARYACIGGIAWLWVKKCWRGGYRKLALQLLGATFPMVLAAVGKKLVPHSGKPPQVIESPQK